MSDPARVRRPRRVARRRHPGPRRRRAAPRPGRRRRAPARRAVAARGARGLAADVVRLRPGAGGRPAGRRRRPASGCSRRTTGHTVVHCCHPAAPLPLLRATGAGALAIDLTDATPARWESIAATLEGGTGAVCRVPADRRHRHRPRCPGTRARGARTGRAGRRSADRARRHTGLRAGRTHTAGGPARSPDGARHRAPSRRGGPGVKAQPRVPWQAKYLALVLIWGSSFLLMKVGLEAHGPGADLGAAHPVRRASCCSLLLLARGGRLPTGARVWGHLFVCGFFLGALPFTLFALVRDADQLGAGRHRQRHHTDRHRARDDGDPARASASPGVGSRPCSSGFVGVVTIMQPWTATDRPDLVGFSMALVGGASYGIGWTYNRRFLSDGRPRRALAADRHPAHRPRAHGAVRHHVGAAAARGPRRDLGVRRRGCR